MKSSDTMQKKNMSDSILGFKVLDDVSLSEIPKDVLDKVSVEYLLASRLLPVGWNGKTLRLAAANPYHYHPIDNLAKLLNASVELFVMDPKRIEQTLRKVMESGLKTPQGLIQEAGESNTLVMSQNAEEDLVRHASVAPVVKMINSILLEAVREKVTDVHFHPKSDGLSVLYRRDGLLHEDHQLPQGMREGIITRLKVMAKMDVTQNRMPQDGRITLKSSDKEIEVRVSVVPTVQGERLVLRLLDRDNLMIRADALGMGQMDYRVLRLLMDRPAGMILVTGPTGSGKTTTLYSFISELNISERNVMTIEDPVEYKLEGITQMQVKPNLGLTFAQGLRSILRQDPDVILVGEIRDEETAQIAIRAALTGHLVLATLHTTDAAGAVTRLLDIGVEPYLISSALMAVVSQRLIRTLCLTCQRKGCKDCYSTGFRGRTGIFELLIIDDDFRKSIYARADNLVLKNLMKQKGIASLEDVGREKVNSGLTTQEEIFRVTGYE